MRYDWNLVGVADIESSPLHRAVENGELAIVERLLEQGQNPNKRAFWGELRAFRFKRVVYPLDVAVRKRAYEDSPKILKALLEAGADQHKISHYIETYPLAYVSDGYHMRQNELYPEKDFVRILLDAKPTPSKFPDEGALVLYNIALTEDTALIDEVIDLGFPYEVVRYVAKRLEWTGHDEMAKYLRHNFAQTIP